MDCNTCKNGGRLQLGAKMNCRYGWRFVAKFNNIYSYSTLCILYAISTLNKYMQAHIIGIFNNKHIYDLFIQLQLCLLIQHWHLLIQESKLIFVQLQGRDKFVQASVNIHSRNVKICWICECRTMSGNLDSRMVYFAERLNGGMTEWWSNYKSRSEGLTRGVRCGTSPVWKLINM